MEALASVLFAAEACIVCVVIHMEYSVRQRIVTHDILITADKACHIWCVKFTAICHTLLTVISLPFNIIPWNNQAMYHQEACRP
jgi:hypothetical protein